MNLINTLRMYAEDMHSATGYSERSSAMSKAADYIERLEKEIAEWKNMSACEACATIPSVMEYVQQLEQERDQLAAQNEGMREAIELYFKQYPHMMKGYILDAINSPNLAAEVLKRRDAEIDLAADRLEVLEREHAEFFDRWHGERRMREKLVDDVERCYRMLLSEPNAKGALFKAGNILREALADAKASTFIPARLSDGLCNG